VTLRRFGFLTVSDYLSNTVFSLDFPRSDDKSGASFNPDSQIDRPTFNSRESTMLISRISCFMTASAALFFYSAVGHPATQDVYQGKMIRIVVGFSPGGAFDAYSRSLSRHMRKYIAGTPNITVENMPGAGSLIAANYLYKAAAPDGLTIGNFIGSVLMGQVLGQKGIEFDARRFEYVGAPARYNPVCLFSKASGITSLDTWIAAKTPVKMGGIGQGTSGDNTQSGSCGRLSACRFSWCLAIKGWRTFASQPRREKSLGPVSDPGPSGSKA
jgi:hypothetical protein